MSRRFPPLAPQEDLFVHPRRAPMRPVPPVPATEVWLALAAALTLGLAVMGG